MTMAHTVVVPPGRRIMYEGLGATGACMQDPGVGIIGKSLYVQR